MVMLRINLAGKQDRKRFQWLSDWFAEKRFKSAPVSERFANGSRTRMLAELQRRLIRSTDIMLPHRARKGNDPRLTGDFLRYASIRIRSPDVLERVIGSLISEYDSKQTDKKVDK